MARDVEFNVTASDKTGTALAAAEAKFKASQARIRKESQKTGDGIGDNLSKGIDRAAPDILGKFKGVFTKAGASGGDALVIGIAAAAPLIGATVSAAVIGGAGALGVIGGVLLAARDPRVKAAGANLGESLMGQLTQSASVFVGPVLRSIDKIEARFGQMRGRLDRVFSNSSGFLGPLVDGALDGIQGILRGFDALLAKGKPVMDSLGRAFRTIGSSVGTAFEVISGGAGGAAKALDVVATGIGNLIVAGAWLVRGLTEVFDAMYKIIGPAFEAQQKLLFLAGVQKEVGTTGVSAATAVKGLVANTMSAGKASGDAAGPLGTFTDKVNNLASAGRSAFDATTGVGEAVDRVTEAAKKNGKTLDENTAKGRENRTALSNLASALLGQYNASVQVNGEGRESNAVAGQNREAFIKYATQLGLSKKAAGDMATAMGLIPAKKESDFTLNTHDAKGRAKAAQDAIDGIHGKTVTVKISVTGLERLDAAGHRIGGYSAGDLSWAAADRGSAMARTGGPTPVSVSSNVAVSLDGAPFYAMSVKAAEDVQRRETWRAKQGVR